VADAARTVPGALAETRRRPGLLVRHQVYDDCRRVLGEHGTFTSSYGAILKMLGVRDPAGGHQMAVSDPPRHTSLRRPQQQLLTTQAVEAHRDHIADSVRDLLAPLRDTPSWDLGTAMNALPMLVSGRLMGLPPADFPQLVHWGLMTVAPDDKEYQVDGDPSATLHAAHQSLFSYFADHVRQRRRSPGKDLGSRDLIGRLMTMAVDGARLTDGQIVSNCYSLLLGANVDTGHVVSSAFLHLAHDQKQYDQWATSPRLFQSGLREALRWSSPVVHFLRYTVKDTEIRGVPVKEGDPVVAWIPSANRDEEVFADPFCFDVGRNPNREIAFGYGPHRCIGAPAALLTLEITFRVLFDWIESFEICGPVEHLKSNFTGGIKHLPLAVELRKGTY
jgi:cytochrome P450